MNGKSSLAKAAALVVACAFALGTARDAAADGISIGYYNGPHGQSGYSIALGFSGGDYYGGYGGTIGYSSNGAYYGNVGYYGNGGYYGGRGYYAPRYYAPRYYAPPPVYYYPVEPYYYNDGTSYYDDRAEYYDDGQAYYDDDPGYYGSGEVYYEDTYYPAYQAGAYYNAYPSVSISYSSYDRGHDDHDGYYDGGHDQHYQNGGHRNGGEYRGGDYRVSNRGGGSRHRQ